MKVRKLVLSVIIVFSHYSFLLAHSGRTDSDGGHFNRKTGEYHYHNSGEKDNDSGKTIVLVISGIFVICATIYNLGDKDKRN
jgi:hypothetical protein